MRHLAHQFSSLQRRGNTSLFLARVFLAASAVWLVMDMNLVALIAGSLFSVFLFTRLMRVSAILLGLGSVYVLGLHALTLAFVGLCLVVLTSPR